MNAQRLQGITLTGTVCAMLLSVATATAQEAGNAGGGDSLVKFAAPVRIQAGGKFLGQGRRHPSPVLHDINGDGLADIVVGDLYGKITSASREPGRKKIAFGSSKPLKDRSGDQLKFENW